jgi:hypothetical protein
MARARPAGYLTQSMHRTNMLVLASEVIDFGEILGRSSKCLRKSSPSRC